MCSENIIDGILELLKNDEQFKDLVRNIIKEYLENLNMHPSKEITPNVLFNNMRDTIEYDFEKYIIVCKVKEILLEARITQKWLAEKTQIPNSSISGILGNSMPVSLNYAMRICKVLGLSVEEGFDFISLENNATD